MKYFALAIVGLSLIASVAVAQTFGPDVTTTYQPEPTFFTSENPNPEPSTTERPTYAPSTTRSTYQPEPTFFTSENPNPEPSTTERPTYAPTTAEPTYAPTTAEPTYAPTTAEPTYAPTTAEPTHVPTTAKPTYAPTTAKPTYAPTTAEPTYAPTTAEPTHVPTTAKPTYAPTTAKPTYAPTTAEPTYAPTTVTHSPTIGPTRKPSNYVNTHCNFTACQEPDCVCLNDQPPKNMDPANIPQFVMITFDGAVTVTNFPYYKDLFDFKNPNGCPIESTFFVSHVDTNYKLVHELHRHGNEIGVHSISKSKNNYQDYWRRLAYSGWKAEFGGQRRFLSRFASIPIEDIKGARAPNLQTAGNVTFTALVDEKFTYDCSNPSRKGVKTPFFPYTLDYGFQRDNDCQVEPCLKLTDVYKGFWDVPMNDLNVQYVVDNVTINRECATVAACVLFDKDGNYIPVPTADEIYNLLSSNFQRFYNGNRAPFPIFLNEDWIHLEHNRNGLLKFLKHLSENKDVYVVSIDSVIEWMKNSASLDEYSKKTCKPIASTACQLKENDPYVNHCDYAKIGVLDGQTKRMVICEDASCPANYPWTNQES